MKLKRISPGIYATLDGRYQVEKQDDNWTECDHPLCYELHQRFIDGDGMHWCHYFVWIVWDMKRGDYADSHHTFETKRDAVQWLTEYLAGNPEVLA